MEERKRKRFVGPKRLFFFWKICAQVRASKQQHGLAKTILLDAKIDGDNPEHIEWLFKVALERANKFGIQGVTYRLTQGVIKNIIPAIASTNAVISASCANEALKYVTKISPILDDYMFFNGAEGIYTYTYHNEKKEDCNACGHGKPKDLEIASSSTVQDLIDVLKQRKE